MAGEVTLALACWGLSDQECWPRRTSCEAVDAMTPEPIGVPRGDPLAVIIGLSTEDTHSVGCRFVCSTRGAAGTLGSRAWDP